ncbi:MAG: hypothetical protein PHC34_10580 [Candidatus Gastranaerophilales bacterium]|nr:hypothetical protein [Candidatus Gastranaerophilales bacterium]
MQVNGVSCGVTNSSNIPTQNKNYLKFTCQTNKFDSFTIKKKLEVNFTARSPLQSDFMKLAVIFKTVVIDLPVLKSIELAENTVSNLHMKQLLRNTNIFIENKAAAQNSNLLTK